AARRPQREVPRPRAGRVRRAHPRRDQSEARRRVPTPPRGLAHRRRGNARHPARPGDAPPDRHRRGRAPARRIALWMTANRRGAHASESAAEGGLMRTAALFALAGSIALLAACASTDRNGDAPLRAVERVSAVEGHWTLVAIDGRPVENLEAIGVRRPPHMVIADDGAAAGFAGVNRYSTRLVLGPAGASFAPA